MLVAEYPYVFSGTAWLPPGSVEGDVVRHTLRGVNIAASPEYRSIEVVLRLYELPNHRFVRHGAHLYAERALPRWHNWRSGAAYVRGLDGSPATPGTALAVDEGEGEEAAAEGSSAAGAPLTASRAKALAEVQLERLKILLVEDDLFSASAIMELCHQVMRAGMLRVGLSLSRPFFSPLTL